MQVVNASVRDIKNGPGYIPSHSVIFVINKAAVYKAKQTINLFKKLPVFENKLILGVPIEEFKTLWKYHPAKVLNLIEQADSFIFANSLLKIGSDFEETLRGLIYKEKKPVYSEKGLRGDFKLYFEERL